MHEARLADHKKQLQMLTSGEGLAAGSAPDVAEAAAETSEEAVPPWVGVPAVPAAGSAAPGDAAPPWVGVPAVPAPLALPLEAQTALRFLFLFCGFCVFRFSKAPHCTAAH